MTVHTTSPGEFLTSLPYQIGFYPHRSLVVVMTRDKTVILVAFVLLLAQALVILFRCLRPASNKGSRT